MSVSASHVGVGALLRAAGSVGNFLDDRLAVCGLSIPKLAALRRLVEAGDSLPLGQLADRLSCVKSNVTQLVDRLEADGLVTRAFDPNDRRSRLAVITEAGRVACEQGARVERAAEDQLLELLGLDDAAKLTEIAVKLERLRC